jgi:hypothetical protein
MLIAPSVSRRLALLVERLDAVLAHPHYHLGNLLNIHPSTATRGVRLLLNVCHDRPELHRAETVLGDRAGEMAGPARRGVLGSDVELGPAVAGGNADGVYPHTLP